MPEYIEQIEIIIDDREQKSEVFGFLAKAENVNVNIRRLSLGDYRVNNRLLVERKTVRDFALSVIDGRLFRQTIRMANSDLRGVVILEGSAAEFSQTGVTRVAAQGALVTVALILGIPVLHSTGAAETAKLIVFAARQLEVIANGGVYRSGYRPKDRRRRQLFILQGLPGVGPERADRLLSSFGSVEKVITASCLELQTVAGIGKGLARKIRGVVSAPAPPKQIWKDRQKGDVSLC